MEKRIKILHWLTIIAIISFCWMQCYWLYNRYEYTLETHEEVLYKSVLDVMQEEHNIRKAMKRPDISILTSTKISASSLSDSAGIQSTVFDIYVVDINKIDLSEVSNADIKEIIRLYETSKPDGITHYNFKITDKPTDPNEYDALERFTVDVRNPFRLSSLDSLLSKQGLKVVNTSIVKTDSMVWLPSRTEHSSIIEPQITITYPYDIFEGELVSVTLAVGVSPVIAKMTDLLILSIVLSVLLITCLVAQIATIRKQRKLEELRQDFIHTMIHELKRPISTLKMCVSFMRNEKLMQDKESKDAIIADSSNELDNLSSYFSKLRDLTFNDATEISLTLSAFNLRNTIKDCIDKLPVPSDKNVEINILSEDDIILTADKMHIANIISNLLENSVKYSGDSVTIDIDYRENDNETVCITIRDNGFGISKTDCQFCFRQWYFWHGAGTFVCQATGTGSQRKYRYGERRGHRDTIHYQTASMMNHTINILLVDDDLKNSMLLKRFLEVEGYCVTHANNGAIGWELFNTATPDLILLDVNMPELNGFELAKKIREVNKKVLIFFLTDRTEKDDRLKGFQLKGNDYIPKPFYPEELIAKIKERFENRTIEIQNEYLIGKTLFDSNISTVTYNGVSHTLTARQTDILLLLSQNMGKMVEREQILRTVWGDDSNANSLALNVQITYLRRILEEDTSISIVSLKKKGYILQAK